MACVVNGATVCVRMPFVTNSKCSVDLVSGMVGIVRRIDAKGDALIKFEDLKTSHWIFKRNFDKLGDPEQVRICSLHHSVLIYKRLYIIVSWL